MNPNSRIVCYDIRDLGKQLMPIGMLVVLDSIFNRVVANRQKGRNTWIIIDEIYLLFQHEYSANFLFTLWKRVRKYGACATGLTQNVDDLLQSHTARTIGNKEISIACNVDKSTLEKSPGWMPDSALPDESGMCVILGHRNRNHLRPLEKVTVGEEITFTYPDGRTAAYTVTEIVIYENTADWRLPSAAGDTLVLVTCYPFRYSGNAPGKFMVVCKYVA